MECELLSRDDKNKYPENGCNSMLGRDQVLRDKGGVKCPGFERETRPSGNSSRVIKKWPSGLIQIISED